MLRFRFTNLDMLSNDALEFRGDRILLYPDLDEIIQEGTVIPAKKMLCSQKEELDVMQKRILIHYLNKN